MFTQDSRTEGFLTRLGVKWEWFEDNTYEELAPTWQQANLGRSRAKVEDAIIEYAERMASGSPAPAPILRPVDGRKHVLDGVQRLGAGQLVEVTRFPAYLVHTDSENVVRTIRVLANHILNGGHNEDKSWTKKQSVQLLAIDGGMSCAEVARLGGWKLADVEAEKIRLTWSFAIRCAGGPEQLTNGVVDNIAKYAKMEDLTQAPKPVAAFLHDLKQGRFSNGDSEPFVRKFFEPVNRKKGKLHDQFEERLEEFHKDPEVMTRLEGRPVNRRDPSIKLRAALKGVITITEEMMAMKTPVLYVEEYFHILNQIRSNIQSLGKAKAKA